MWESGTELPAHMVVYFNSGVPEEQAGLAISEIIDLKRPDGRGTDLRPGIRGVFHIYTYRADGHRGVAIDFFENADKDRRRIKEAFESNRLVFKVFENIAPGDTKVIS